MVGPSRHSHADAKINQWHNVGANGDAFAVANNTTMTVMDLLLAADNQAINGLLYGGDTRKRNEANNVFSALNQAGGI